MKGSIRQRGRNSFEVSVFLGRNEKGKRLRKTETVRGTKKEAQQRLRQILTEMDKGITPSTERYTLREWLSVWMDEIIVPNSKLKTIDRYRGAIDSHILPYLGRVEIAKLAPRQIQELEVTLIREKGLQPKGVNLVHGILSGALKYALKMDVISRNPVNAVSPPPIRRREVECPEISDVKRLLTV